MMPTEKENVERLKTWLDRDGIAYYQSFDRHDDDREHVCVVVDDETLPGGQSIDLWPQSGWIRMNAYLSVENAESALSGIAGVMESDLLFEMASKLLEMQVKALGYAEGES